MRGRSLAGRRLGGAGHGLGVRRRRPGGDPGGGVAAYTAVASDFDGTNDYLRRSSDLTGNADAKQGTLSVWLNLEGGDGLGLAIYETTGDTVRIDRLTTDIFSIRAENSAGTRILDITTVATYTTANGWLNLLASWDMAVAGARHIYVNDVADLTEITFTDDTIDYTVAEHNVCSKGAGAGRLWNGCMSELYLNMAEYLDLSVTANRRLFITADGKPVDLDEDDGSKPTGTAPIVYLNNPFGTFEQNKGTGGNFTVTGALTECASSPSD